MTGRIATLRNERIGGGSRHLEAYLTAEGNLRIDGQDLGAGTEIVSSSGEYEWSTTIRAADIPRLLEALGASRDDDVLDVLAANYCDSGSHRLEEILRSGVVPIERWVR